MEAKKASARAAEIAITQMNQGPGFQVLEYQSREVGFFHSLPLSVKEAFGSALSDYLEAWGLPACH